MKIRLSLLSSCLSAWVLANCISIAECHSLTIADHPQVDFVAVDKIVFYSERDGNAEIYMISLDGTDEVRLTANRFMDIVPDLSPDGNHIVFISDRRGNHEIFKMRTDGTEVLRLTNTPAEEAYPFWSSDNSKIIFCSKRDGGNFEIYMMNPDGTGQTRMTHTGLNEEWAHLSPDGKKIVFGAGRFPNYKVYSCDPDGKNLQELSQGAIPKWSRDGRMIAHNKLAFINEVLEGDFCVMNSDGTESRRVTNSPPGTVSENPSWSPDGTKFAFQSNITGNFQIYIVDALGNNRKRVTHHGGNDYWPSWGRIRVPVK